MKEIDDTKDKIIECARKLFQQFGFDKTSMDDIAKSSHKAKGSIYYHFSNKEDLIANVIGDEINKMKVKLLLIVNDSSVSETDRLIKYLINRMDFLNSAITYHQAMRQDLVNHFIDNINSFDTYQPFVDIFNELDKWENEQLSKMIEEGKRNNNIRYDVDTNGLIDMILMVIKSLEVPFFIKGKYKKYSSIFKTLVITVVQTLTPSFNHNGQNVLVPLQAV